MFQKILMLFVLSFTLSANANFIDVSKHSKNKKNKTTQSKTQPYKVANRKQFSCGKRKCSQMNSCAEARYHLTQCKVKSLDRDNDGVPCENLCSGA